MSDTRPKLAAIHEVVQRFNPAPDAWITTPARFMVDPGEPLLGDTVPALLAAIDAVLALHKPCDNDPDRTPICPTCHGKAGMWGECGCWSDEDRIPVCGICVEVDAVHNGHGAAPWPCPTVHAITEHIDVEVQR